jgi:hypothetical protein
MEPSPKLHHQLSTGAPVESNFKSGVFLTPNFMETGLNVASILER